jgi:guanidinopropionase
VMLQSLRGRHLVGADLCEVAPMYDLTGQTALNAANLLFELLSVVADSRVAQASSSRRA